MNKKSLPLLLVFFAFTVLFTACQTASKQEESTIPSASRELYAMDTYMTLSAYGENCEEALNTAASEINRLDKLLSVSNPKSEISRINEDNSRSVSPDTKIIIQKSLELYETTNGYFDITIYPLMKRWGFIGQNFTVPSEKEIKEALNSVGSELLSWDEQTGMLTLREGQGIDLGGIAKGYTSDCLSRIFEEYELTAAVVSLGGNVHCYGSKPDGSAWRCGIRDPFHAEEISSVIGVLEIKDGAVITSGAYERCFTGEDGTLYHHILDPHTGFPAKSDLVSVTIVSPSGVLADGLSTACYILGLNGATEYWRKNSDSFDMVLVTENKEIYITVPLKERFSASLPVHVLEP